MSPMLLGLLLFDYQLLRLAALPTNSVKSAVISNIEPHVDAKTGEIMDLHDGTTLRVGDVFFWYGSGYGGCSLQAGSGCANTSLGACGFQDNHTVNLATSTDLMNWTFHGSVYSPSDRPYGILFSPWVARSAATGKFVLWSNILPIKDGRGDFMHAHYAIATSDSPYGPFSTIVKNVTGLAYYRLPDAASVFVDDDGKGYLAFTHEDSHINHVQELSPDLLGPLPGGGVSTQVGPGSGEGAFMFKRNGIYYVGYGTCDCFGDQGGADVSLFSSKKPLGPYALVGTIANKAQWHGQTGSVWSTGIDYVLYGDRWQTGPDHIKGHDFSYWTPLHFLEDGTVEAIEWQDNVTVRYVSETGAQVLI